MPNIICFGKNYDDHMHELGDKPVSKPVIFLKPENVLRVCKKWGDTIDLYFPDVDTQQIDLYQTDIHHEVELVFKLKTGGFKMNAAQAAEAIGWYTVGLDMTKRTLQKQLKTDGHPWEISKIFPDAAVIGPWKMMDGVDDMKEVLSQPFSFLLNNKLRQKSQGAKMLFSPVDLIIYASQYFPLSAGDILFTGTPAGVGNIARGDIGAVTLNQEAYTVRWR